MNPLEHHTFRELLTTREQVCKTSEGNFTLRSYNFTYMNYFKGRVQERWWHHISCTSLSQFIVDTARERGLLSFNGIYTCLICLSSEYVKSDDRLNGGDATCKCGCRFKGWGEE